MRCLHCGNEVSLLQKLSDPQFCSAEHRQNFHDDQQRLMLQRLERFRRERRSDAATISVSEKAAAPADVTRF